jgi:DNA polymerase-3 subunit beta
MKVTVTQENLNKGLFVSGHIASQHTTLPILNSILFEAKQEGLFLKATDLEIGITMLLRGKVEKEGSFAIDSRLISNYITLLPPDRVDLELKDNKLVISSLDQIAKIHTLKADEYPIIPHIDQKQVYKSTAQSVRSALASVVFCASVDSARPELNGVLVLLEKDKMTLVGTDSYRLAEKAIRIDSNLEKSTQFILPLKTAKELMRTIPDSEDEIKIIREENQVGFLYTDIEMVTRTVDSEYPDYKQILPNGNKSRVVLPKEDLMRAVKAAGLFSQSSSGSITLELSSEKGEVSIFSSSAAVGENKTNIKAPVEGKDEKVILNYRYLLEGLQNISGQDAVIETTDQFSPVVVRPREENKNYLYLVMPIRQ